jgi:hypothetical protein
MKRLTLEEIEKWTFGRPALDFADFSIPTTETTRWGSRGEIVCLDLNVHVHDGAKPGVIIKSVLSGEWNQDNHGLTFPVQSKLGRRSARILHAGRDKFVGNVGLYGLVRLSMSPGWQDKKLGFSISARCLIEDEKKMESLVKKLATEEIDRLIEAFSAARTLLIVSENDSTSNPPGELPRP